MRLLAIPLCAAVTAACAAKPAPTGEQLVPADANLLIGVDLAGVLDSEMYGLFKPIVAKDLRGLERIDLIRECGVDVVASRVSLILGTDGGDNVAAVFAGDGIGDATKLQCIADKLTALDGAAPFVVVDRGVATPSLDSDVATVVDARTVVIATRAWAAPVRDLTLGKGSAAAASPSKHLFARADRTAHVWFAGLVPKKMAVDMRATFGSEPLDLFGALDLAAGLRFSVDVGFGGPERLNPLKQKIEEASAMLRAVGPMMGLPPNAADSLKLEIRNEGVHFEVAMSVADSLELAKRMTPVDPPPIQDSNPHPPPS